MPEEEKVCTCHPEDICPVCGGCKSEECKTCKCEESAEGAKVCECGPDEKCPVCGGCKKCGTCKCEKPAEEA